MLEEFSHDKIANVLNCGLEESEFELQLCYYVRFRPNTLGKDINSFIPTPAGGKTVSQLFFYKGNRTHRLHLSRRVSPPSNESPVYGIKQSEGEASVMLEHWEIWSTPSLPLLPDPIWPRVVALYRVLSMSQIELFDI